MRNLEKQIKKIFEEWGYIVDREWDIRIPKTREIRKGIKYKKDDGGCITILFFNPIFKILQIVEYETYNKNRPQGEVFLPMELINIFPQQMKELGWLEDEIGLGGWV